MNQAVIRQHSPRLEKHWLQYVPAVAISGEDPHLIGGALQSSSVSAFSSFSARWLHDSAVPNHGNERSADCCTERTATQTTVANRCQRSDGSQSCWRGWMESGGDTGQSVLRKEGEKLAGQGGTVQWTRERGDDATTNPSGMCRGSLSGCDHGATSLLAER